MGARSSQLGPRDHYLSQFRALRAKSLRIPLRAGPRKAGHELLPIGPLIPLSGSTQPAPPATLPPDGVTPAGRPEIVYSGVEPPRRAPGPSPGWGFEPASSDPGNYTHDRQSAPAALRPSRPWPGRPAADLSRPGPRPSDPSAGRGRAPMDLVPRAAARNEENKKKKKTKKKKQTFNPSGSDPPRPPEPRPSRRTGGRLQIRQSSRQPGRHQPGLHPSLPL